MKNKDISIAIIGLGYVGLPLANGLSKNFKTNGYDINKKVAQDCTALMGALSKDNFTLAKYLISEGICSV